MINDLSTLSRAERDKLSVEAEAINAYDLVVDLANNYASMASQKGLTITTDIDPHLEILQSGKLYVREILQNFITNAIKYTETGNVTIGAKPATKGVTFWVRDSGIGIGKSDQQKIFDKFFRSEDFRTRQNNGTGLGLYVTVKLIRLLHGEVEVSSKLNVGSTFSVTFPNLK
jgi:signal transduction histidine kinase